MKIFNYIRFNFDLICRIFFFKYKCNNEENIYEKKNDGFVCMFFIYEEVNEIRFFKRVFLIEKNWTVFK